MTDKFKSLFPVGFGGIPIQRLSVSESDRLLAQAVEAGVNFFDTARIYTDSEDKMGRVLPAYAERLLVASKTYSRDGQAMSADIDLSLKKLGLERIDLYQCHNVSTPADLDRILAPGGALEAMENARQQGKIGAIGITGHKPWIVETALDRYPFFSLQVPFNFIERKAAETLLPKARRLGVLSIAMKPLAGGAFGNGPLSLRWNLLNGVDLVIPGMDKTQQIAENVAVARLLRELSVAELTELQAVADRLGDSFCRRCEYCMPCPQGLNIPFLHLLEAYYFRYDLKDWAWERILAQPKRYSDCIACGECVRKCPYELDTPRLFADDWQRIQAHHERKDGQ